MARPRSFLEQLFDFSFSEFITPKIVGVLYAIGIFFISIVLLGFLGASFQSGNGVIGLLLTPLMFLLYVILLRVGLEGLVVAFRTSENTKRTADNTENLGNP